MQELHHTYTLEIMENKLRIYREYTRLQWTSLKSDSVCDKVRWLWSICPDIAPVILKNEAEQSK